MYRRSLTEVKGTTVKHGGYTRDARRLRQGEGVVVAVDELRGLHDVRHLSVRRGADTARTVLIVTGGHRTFHVVVHCRPGRL